MSRAHACNAERGRPYHGSLAREGQEAFLCAHPSLSRFRKVSDAAALFRWRITPQVAAKVIGCEAVHHAAVESAKSNTRQLAYTHWPTESGGSVAPKLEVNQRF